VNIFYSLEKFNLDLDLDFVQADLIVNLRNNLRNNLSNYMDFDFIQGPVI